MSMSLKPGEMKFNVKLLLYLVVPSNVAAEQNYTIYKAQQILQTMILLY